MPAVLGILLGAICSGGTALSLGVALVRRLGLRLERLEFFALSMVVGTACYSQIVFFLCSIGLARVVIFIGIALISALAAVVPGGIETQRSSPAMPRRLGWLYAALFLAFGIVYLVNAMAPEISPDGSAYHLPIVMRYLQAHGFDPHTRSFYSSLSQGIDLVYLPAYSIGRSSAAAMVHLLFLLDLPLLMMAYGRRFGFPLPAAAAAFLVFASPIFGWDGTSAYNDVAVAAILFALYYSVQIWAARREPGMLTVIGVLAGFSYAAKYSAAVAIPYAAGFVAWTLWQARKPVVRPVVTLCGIAAFFVLPWMIKNTLLTGNPVAPFANALFPNPYVHVSFEQQYRTYLQHYRLTTWWQAPWELAVKGERLQGLFGPVFLLLPLGILSLRRREGRNLLLAGAVFALPWFFNVGTRFLLPALPPLTLALVLALRNPLPLLPAMAVAHAVLSWYVPPIRYFDAYAPRLAAFPLRAALRLEPEYAYLERSSSGYRIDRMIEGIVPLGDRVFSFEQIPEAWTSRQILVGYTSAENEVLSDILQTPLDPALDPARAWRFRLAPQLLCGLRAVQTAWSANQMWSISEFQLLNQGKLLRAAPGWRWNANPNPWGVSLAFDSKPVTRWRSWQSARPGMFFEVVFDKPQLLDEVRLLTTPDARESHVKLLGMDAGGGWHEFPTGDSISSAAGCDLRPAAVEALIARGIRYLLVSPGAFGANDFNDNPGAWGLQLQAETDGRRLYRLIGVSAGLPSDPPDPPPVAVPPGFYDDPDPRISLHAAWTRDTQFLDADRHTLTYTDIAGASAELSFQGDSITYVYTRAFNRGIAEISVDGQVKDRLDLYSRRTEWQQRMRYAHLGPGPHTLRVRVTGEKNPNAADCFVDVDALIVE